jgi:hypothetical protein
MAASASSSCSAIRFEFLGQKFCFNEGKGEHRPDFSTESGSVYSSFIPHISGRIAQHKLFEDYIITPYLSDFIKYTRLEQSSDIDETELRFIEGNNDDFFFTLDYTEKKYDEIFLIVEFYEYLTLERKKIYLSKFLKDLFM